MRIRRNASKLLGSATVFANPSPPPPEAAAAEPEGMTVCELNCSPWDVMSMNPDDSDSFCCDFLSNPKEDEEESGGTFGNFVKMEEEPISAITSTAAELTLEEMKEIEHGRDHKKVVVKKEDRKPKPKLKTNSSSSSKGKEKAAAAAAEDSGGGGKIIYCKKSDGKGWHCKRPAQLPHSLCSYHLAQIRSYSANQRAAANEAAAAADSSTPGKNNRHNADNVVRADSSFYYYYCGFGPWRGKRRGRPPAANGNDDVKEVVGEEEENSNAMSSREMSSMERDRDDDAATATAVAGADEYVLDLFDDEDEDGGYRSGVNKEEGKKEEGDGLVREKKRPVPKKRGRKPMKSRSLKSLL